MGPESIYGAVLARPAVDFGQVRDGRRSPISYFDVDLTNARSIATNSQLVVNVAGDSFFCDLDPVNQGAAIVHVQDTALSMPSAPIYCPPGAILKAPFTQLLIENAAQSGKRLRVFFGVGIDFAVGAAGNVNVSGTVSVQDGNKARTLAGGAFAWRPFGNSANFNHAQLWNPAGSGKNLIVDGIALSSSLAGNLTVGTYNLQIVGAGGPALNIKSDSAAASVAVSLAQTLGVLTFTRQYGTGQVPANGTFDFSNVLKRPIVIGPSTGLMVAAETAASILTGFVSYFEEPQ